MSQLILTWLSLCPPDENIKKRPKIAYFLFTVTMFLIEFIGFLSSIAFLLTYLRRDLNKALYSVFQIASSSSVMYTMCAVFFLRHKISKIFTNLSEIYKSSENHFDFFFSRWTLKCLIFIIIFFSMKFRLNSDENENSFEFLAQANNSSEWIWKMYIKLVLFGFPCTTFSAAAASVAICWLIKRHFDAKFLFYPLKLL